MSMISLVSAPIGVESSSADHSFATILLFACVGLVASFGLMAMGVDVSAAWA